MGWVFLTLTPFFFGTFSPKQLQILAGFHVFLNLSFESNQFVSGRDFEKFLAGEHFKHCHCYSSILTERERERERRSKFSVLFLLHFGYPTGTLSFWETSNIENEKTLRVWGECFSRQQQKVGIWWSPKVTKVLRGSPTFKDTKSYHTMPEWQKFRYHSEECYLMPLI